MGAGTYGARMAPGNQQNCHYIEAADKFPHGNRKTKARLVEGALPKLEATRPSSRSSIQRASAHTFQCPFDPEHFHKTSDSPRNAPAEGARTRKNLMAGTPRMFDSVGPGGDLARPRSSVPTDCPDSSRTTNSSHHKRLDWATPRTMVGHWCAGKSGRRPLRCTPRRS